MADTNQFRAETYGQGTPSLDTVDSFYVGKWELFDVFVMVIYRVLATNLNP